MCINLGGHTRNTIQRSMPYNENGVFANLFIFASNVSPSAPKNALLPFGSLAECTNAGLRFTTSLYATSVSSALTSCNKAFPFSVLMVTADMPRSSSNSGNRVSMPQKSPSVMSLPLFNCLAGQA